MKDEGYEERLNEYLKIAEQLGFFSIYKLKTALKYDPTAFLSSKELTIEYKSGGESHKLELNNSPFGVVRTRVKVGEKRVRCPGYFPCSYGTAKICGDGSGFCTYPTPVFDYLVDPIETVKFNLSVWSSIIYDLITEKIGKKIEDYVKKVYLNK